MKILFCMYDLFASGAETQFRNLVYSLLENDNIELIMLFEQLDHDNGSESLEILKKYGLEYYNANFIPNNTVIKRVIKKVGCGELLTKFRREKINRILKCVGNIDWVVTYNYTFLPYIDLFQNHGARVLFSERQSGEWLAKIANVAELLKKCSAITCNSMKAKRYLETIYSVKVQYIKNGIRIQEEKYSPHTNLSGRRLLVVARISPEKNIEVVLRALCRCRKMNFSLSICGNVVSNAYYQKLKKMIHEMKLDDSVHIEGYRNDIEDFYSIADCLILPSLVEGTPNAILEAFSHGIPVLASNIEENSALFDDMNVLFDPKDDLQLTETIKYMFTRSSDELLTIVKRNYEFVNREFAMNRMCCEYKKIMCCDEQQ